jgi:ATPase subunit of ABC transporter with duplicated ATPase domains
VSPGDNVSKQHGPQILFIDASAALLRGEKVGLVGPNGAGKSTIFRLIVGEESVDDGQISIDRKVTIGHFSQDVGEMQGMSALAATMDGAGPLGGYALEARAREIMASPARGRLSSLQGSL